MSNVFHVGQLVQAKSGGPEMRVVSVVPGTIQEAYYCSWLVGSEKHSGEFLGEALMPVKDHFPEQSLCSSNTITLNVYGAHDQRIGNIDHLLIDMVSGKVAYAVVSFDDLANRTHPVPWSALKYDPSSKSFRTGITESQLQEAPILSHDSPIDREWETRTHQHYDAPTYWGSTTAHQRPGSS